MPGSLNYSPSGSEGGRSSAGGDLEKSPIGVDLTTTPGNIVEMDYENSLMLSPGTYVRLKEARAVSVVEQHFIGGLR